MKISAFMDWALFDKEQGYYKTKNPIGKNSDFITAPEISQIFGEIVAAYILQISAAKNSSISFVEMGAGKGTWFFDILTTIVNLAEKNSEIAQNFLKKTQFNIIEINPVLRLIQQEKLKDFAVNWHESFEEFLNKKTADSEIFFISNELFDCFAIDQFVLTEIGWRERIVQTNELKQRFFALDSFSFEVHNFVEKEISNQQVPLQIGSVFEYSFAAQDFMKKLCQALKDSGGMAINFDYGYWQNGFFNSLQALKNHQKVDVLKEAPNCDITALVNFEILEKIAKNSALNSSLVTQGNFLESLGIKEREQFLIEKNPQKSQEITDAVARLIKKDAMGELFKCHIIWS